jgi:hypothetical protein
MPCSPRSRDSVQAAAAPPPAAPAAPEERAPYVVSAQELRRKNREVGVLAPLLLLPAS